MQNIDPNALIEGGSFSVLPEWLDLNGHMNIAFYLRAFDLGSEAAFTAIGIGWDYLRQGEGTTFTLESRLRYLKEVREGDPLRITLQLLDLDAKRLHFFARMHQTREGYLAATHESLVIHVDLKTRRTTPFPPALLERLGAVVERHRALPRPEGLDQPLGIRRR